MTSRPKAGVLDLSQVEDAGQKVKLPDGRLYDMAQPTQLSPLAYQRFISRYRRSQELQAKPEPTEVDAEEMLDLVIDLACIVVPDAERETLGSLPYPKLQRLVEAFFGVSPTDQTEPPTAA